MRQERSIAEIIVRHRPARVPPNLCRACGVPFPCDAAIVLRRVTVVVTALRKLQERVADARVEVASQ